MTDFRDVDFFTDPSLLEDPLPYYDYLREIGPVVPLPQRNSVAVVGFEECVQVLRDTQTYSSCNSGTGPIPPLPFTPEGDDISAQLEAHRSEIPYHGQVVTLDAPQHWASRSLLMRLFSSARLEEMRAFMLEASSRQIDSFAHTGRCEFFADYGSPFATLVIADLLGVPEEDRDELRRRLSPEVREKLNALPGQIGVDEKPPIAFDFLKDKFIEYVDDRRAKPRDDVISTLCEAKFPDGSTPEAMEIVRLTTFLFAAGQESTARFMTAALRLLAEDSALQTKLRSDPSLTNDFIEEALRLEGTTKTDGRLARKTTTLAGVKVPAGTTMVLMFGAANRDPRRYEAPNEFRFGRPKAREHLAFGRGPHTCAGAPLARAESRITIDRFLERFREIRISEEHHGPPEDRHYRYNPSYVLRGLRELYLELEPADS